MRRLAVLLLPAVIVGVAVVVFVLADDSPDVRVGPPGAVAEVEAAVPGLLGRSCLLGTIALDNSMGGIERGQLIDVALDTLATDVAQIWAEPEASEVAGQLSMALEAMRQGEARALLDCGFSVSRMRSVEVDGSEAHVDVEGVYHEVAPVSDRRQVATTSYNGRTTRLAVELRREDDLWKLTAVDPETTSPPS